ncbi:enoyl-CoA hydratase/isomerase family protein [Actinosynnema sp. NPDC023587]|uniref:enoyl-CoA hydratase/isomerase family protein n=1 Tax=Actinosynnema sp. NPDC023587 TaxID=3154695 RepID=UPI0033E5098B
MPVTVEPPGDVAVIRLDQPLGDVLAGVRALADVTALVLHGGPRACAPTSDLKALVRVAPAVRRAHLGRLHDLRDALGALPVPVVAAIGGSAFGDVADLAAACDHRVLAEGAELVSLAGTGVLCARRVPAAEALRTGLVDQVVPVGAVLTAAVELARRCAAVPVGGCPAGP